MSEFAPSDWIHTVKASRLTIDGEEYPVATYQFTHQHNGIPGVKLTLAVARSVDDTLDIVNMAEVIKYQNKLQGKINTPATKVELDLAVMATGGHTQTVSLKKWVLQGAGVEQLSVAGEVVVSVVIMHPAYKSRQSTLAVYNSMDDVQMPELKGTNVYEWLIYAMRQYLKKVDEQAKAKGGVATLTETLVAKTAEAVDALEENITWDGLLAGNNYPLEHLEQTDGLLKRSVQEAVWNTGKVEGSNPFDAMMDMLGEMQLCLTGTFTDDPLKIVPYEPWGGTPWHKFDEDINQLVMPPEDPRPIAGVIMRYQGDSGEFGLLPPGYYINVDGKKLNTAAMTAAAAEKDKIPDLLGEIVTVDAPMWLRGYRKEAPGAAGLEFSFLNTGVAGDVHNPGSGPGAADVTTNMENFLPLAEAYCSQMFWSTYRAGVQISMVTRFELTYAGVANVVAGEPHVLVGYLGGEWPDLLRYFCDRVTHILDARNAQAYTQITGSYVRSSDGIFSGGKAVITADEIKAGTPNPLWAKPAKDKGPALPAVVPTEPEPPLPPETPAAAPAQSITTGVQ